MKPAFDHKALFESKPWEYAVRFGFGGLVTVCTGLVAKRWGLEVGGLFLAFPAILPATLTLVKDHDGRTKAADDARGAGAGAIGIAAFAAVIWLSSTRLHPLLAMLAATAAWIVVSVASWALGVARR
jgi:hypothetical protein